MRADEKDLVLGREFQLALDTGFPQPSWGEIAARVGGLSLRWRKKRLKVVLAYAVVLLAIRAAGNRDSGAGVRRPRCLLRELSSAVPGRY